MLEEAQVKLLQQRQKIKMFYGTPAQVAETVNQWIEKTPVYIIDQKIEVIEQTVLVSLLYASNLKPTAAGTQPQQLPGAKGQQHPLINMEAIKAAYEQG